MQTGMQHGAGTVAEQDELLDLAAAAEQLCVSKTTLYRMLDRGEVTGIKVGRQWRFRPRDLEAYLSRGPVAAALAAMPLDVLDAEVAAIAAQLRLTGDAMPAVGDAALDQWEARLVQIWLGLAKLARVRGASDIHCETIKEGDHLHGFIRFRIDGVLHEVHRMPGRVYAALVMRMRIMANGDPGTGGYLDASLHLPIDGGIEDVRVSAMPTFLGEAVTLRLHAAADIRHSTLDELGMHADDVRTIRRWLSQPSGLVITAAPSGAGKTTLLYKMLQALAHPARKVVTIEDPVEYQLPEVMQVEINARTRNFPSALRAFLRQDVEVIMVGELRDLESVDLAIHAAEYGHLVMTAVHVTNPLDAVHRIVDVFPAAQQGPIRAMLAKHLLGVVGMRLVRLLCPHCKGAIPLPDALRARGQQCGVPIPEHAMIYRAVGCPACGQTGYRGRTGMYEVLEITPALREAYLHGAAREELLARTGGRRTLAAEALRLMLEGLTSPEEVYLRIHRED